VPQELAELLVKRHGLEPVSGSFNGHDVLLIFKRFGPVSHGRLQDALTELVQRHGFVNDEFGNHFETELTKGLNYGGVNHTVVTIKCRSPTGRKLLEHFSNEFGPQGYAGDMKREFEEKRRSGGAKLEHPPQ